ncbi:MAG: TonB family protein [Sinobacteraceae bacterium]|nr:TonB family protein [Nevskiaceae bacterium]
MNAQSDPVIGQEVDGYRIESVLGRGGMAVVYKAEDLALARPAAIKRINPGLMHDERFLRRFRSEAQALARLDSPYITGIYTLRQTELGLLIVMEYVEGETLESILQSGAMSPAMTHAILVQVLHALEDAHDAGLIHRDIKPSNILVTPQRRAKVTDFGIAKALERDPQATETMGIVGTLNYMSPEQIQGRDLGPQSDLFSLGLTAYHMLTGVLPFDRRATDVAKMRAIVDHPFAPPARLQKEVPSALSRIIAKALEKDPSRRYSSARQMRSALECIQFPQAEGASVTVTGHASLAAANGRTTRILRPGNAALAAMVLALLVGGGSIALYLPTWLATNAGPEHPRGQGKHLAGESISSPSSTAANLRREAPSKKTERSPGTMAKSSALVSAHSGLAAPEPQEPEDPFTKPDAGSTSTSAQAVQPDPGIVHNKLPTQAQAQRSSEPRQRVDDAADKPPATGSGPVRTAKSTRREPTRLPTGPIIVFERTMVDQAPRLIGRLQPAYPVQARRDGIEGRVVVQFIVDEQGSAQDINILMSPSRLLSQAAIDALQAARFRPGQKNGRPVKVRTSKTLAFNLR